jgi:PPM family protein phosphatase
LAAVTRGKRVNVGLRGEMIESYSISDCGGRAENQDRVLADHSLGLFAIADGMGGHQSGSVAAEVAISTLVFFIESSVDRFDVSWPFGYSFDVSVDGNRLRTGIQLANGYVTRRAESSPEYAGMGTTVAALLLGDETAVIGNVGDSRVYLFREGTLVQLTCDDTMAQSPLGALVIDEEVRREMQHVLMQAVGSQETVDVHLREEHLRPGDLFLLTSDGLHGTLGDSAIRTILCRKESVQRNTEDLLKAAIAQGASDNVSLVLLSYGR